jgi:ABC-type sugar transport system permease subunit
MFQRARRRLLLPFLLPQTILFILITLLPLAMTVAFGFTNWQGHGMQWRVIGLRNFRIVFKDFMFWSAARNTFFIVIVGGLLLFVPAMLMAWSLHQPIRAKRYFRFIILAPIVLSVSAVAVMWTWIYNPTWGLINPVMEKVGLGQLALPWLGDSRTALTAIIVTSIWHGIGATVLMLSAGLERIPPDLMEAAKVDGAGDWQLFRHVTVPLMWGVLRIMLVMWVIGALQAFSFFWIMGRGLMGATEVMATYVWKKAFIDFKWAYAMALATFMLIMIFALSSITNRVLTREAVEY